MRKDLKVLIFGLIYIIFLSLFGACYDLIYAHGYDGVGASQQTIPLPSQTNMRCTDHEKRIIYILNYSKNYTDTHQPILDSVSAVNFSFFSESRHTDQYQQPNWETDENCRLIIRKSSDRFDLTSPAKIIYVSDKADFCGMAGVDADRKKTPNNLNNKSSSIFISTRCLFGFVFLHELLHSFGAINPAAPNNDGGYHSTLFGDIMGVNTASVPSNCLYLAIDCNKNSYYNNSNFIDDDNYLLANWSTSDSLYLQNINYADKWYIPYVGWRLNGEAK